MAAHEALARAYHLYDLLLCGEFKSFSAAVLERDLYLFGVLMHLRTQRRRFSSDALSFLDLLQQFFLQLEVQLRQLLVLPSETRVGDTGKMQQFVKKTAQE